MTNVTVLRADSPGALARALDIRAAVFTGERGVSPAVERDAWDTLDGPCAHYLIRDGGADAGAFRVCRRGSAAALQRFCVLKQARGRGVGRAALEALAALCRGAGLDRVVLDAKLDSRVFYERCAFRTLSEPFQEAGVPHVKMERRL